MGIKKNIHVLSNTHWDREWRFPYQETRLLLVDLLDRLLNILEQQPDFKYYNLDSQTIPLEDYLEFRPENRKRLERLISDGRLVVGPWYTLPEENSVLGECLVRNLLMGKRVGDSFGKTCQVGYTPTSYGQISQIAQIYAGFGIDGMIFYRGIYPDECTNEYFLEAPDGSRILGIRLSRHVGRGAFYLYISRRTMHDKDWMGYSWGEEGCLSFHPCVAEENHEDEPVLIRSNYRQTCNLENVEEGVRHAMQDILQEATTDCLVLFDGMDSTAPNENLPAIIERANQVNRNWKFIHSSLPLYLEDLKSRIDPSKLTVLKGERRHPSKDNLFNAFLKDSISSRMYLKQRNAEVERRLVFWADPFSCIAWKQAGEEFPEAPLTHAWKYLLACHPHDSIGGLSPDQIHNDMMYRFDQADIIGNALTKKALASLVAQIDTSESDPEDVLITVFNPLPAERNAVPVVYVDFPQEKQYRAFTIEDPDGKPVTPQLISREDSYLIATEANEIPMTFKTTKWKIAFEASGLPPVGFKTYRIHPEEGKLSNYGSQLVAANVMENEFLRVEIESNGTLTVTDKATGQVYPGILYFEDSGEAGDPWMYIPPFADKSYSTLGLQAEIRLAEDGPLLTTFEIRQRMKVPAELNRLTKQRSQEEAELEILSKISLHKGVPRLNVRIEVNNTAKDHRLRVLFDSGFRPKKSHAGSQFDVVQRDVALPDTSRWLEPHTGTHPHHGFVSVENGKRGLGVLTFGLTEYEVFDHPTGAIAITLLRSYGYPKMSGLGREDRVVREGNEGSQCLGKQNYDIGLYFYSGKWEESGLLQEALNHRCPPFAVHHSRYAGKPLGRCESFFKLEPETLCLSCIKKAESGDRLIVRFYNPLNKAVEGKLWCRFDVAQAFSLKLNEEEIQQLKVEKEHWIPFKAGKKKIITLGIDLK